MLKPKCRQLNGAELTLAELLHSATMLFFRIKSGQICHFLFVLLGI
ncbi:hypothetical protein RNAN_3446 [Rheinheimera nanhaiensis E407-8]|uniref:Uncharacterized protein n=1 Tax=Rheinheimera nanhaiensis E407-8 TaxID=562729 RepID=I1E294_9GAMM|nr:hypothetical protein RNAN_3446 [Rheinheimera nanhaiensis E407-8]